jgi:hypothetical protein
MAGVKNEIILMRHRTIRAVRWAMVLCVVAVAGGIICYIRVRRSPPVPLPEKRPLFQGIFYHRDVMSIPRPLVVHLLKIDLRAPGLSFLVTPPQNAGVLPLQAQTTSQFLGKSRAQIAVNGDFFAPWHSRFLWDYYPHVGDPVQVDGMAVAQGREYSRGHAHTPVLVIGKNNRVEIFDSPQVARKQFPASKIENAISGNTLLIRDKRAMPLETWFKDHADLHPRTAIGISKTRGELIVIVVDGRQKNYSEGVSLSELATMLLEAGAETAINLDGGGSTTLVVQQSQNGVSQILNSPIDNHIPGRERAVANHLAIFARPLSQKTSS